MDTRKPDGPALAWLRSRFGFHPLDIEDLTTRSQRPKLDVHDEYLLLVLHFPVYNRQAQVSTPSEAHVFLGADYLLFPIFNKVGGRLDTIEAKLFEQPSRLLVYEISLVRRDIIALHCMLRPMLPVMARLEGEAIPQLPPALDLYSTSTGATSSTTWSAPPISWRTIRK